MNEEVRLDIALKVGAVTEMVTVSGMASTVDTSTGTLKTVVDQERIENLPLNGRNPTQLHDARRGRADRSQRSHVRRRPIPGTRRYSSSGARGNTTNYVLDGGSNNDHYSNGPNPMPNPDALQEFSVQTNSFSAEYGRNVGAIVNAVTRAGTNQYHGLGFGYFRHYKFNATNFFTPGVDDGLKRSQYGGTFGGPIARNRTFFFALVSGNEPEARPTEQLRPGADRGHAQRRFLRRSRARSAIRSPGSRSRTTRFRRRSSAPPRSRSSTSGCRCRTRSAPTTR